MKLALDSYIHTYERIHQRPVTDIHERRLVTVAIHDLRLTSRNHVSFLDVRGYCLLYVVAP